MAQVLAIALRLSAMGCVFCLLGPSGLSPQGQGLAPTIDPPQKAKHNAQGDLQDVMLLELYLICYLNATLPLVMT